MNGSLAFTWSPDPKRFKGVRPEYQLYDTLPIIRLLRQCSKSFIIYPELNIQGNIHYHGIIDISDKIKWHKKVLPSFKFHGFVVLKTIFDLNQWNDYIKKDREVMKDIINTELPLTCDHRLIRKRSNYGFIMLDNNS